MSWLHVVALVAGFLATGLGVTRMWDVAVEDRLKTALWAAVWLGGCVTAAWGYTGVAP